MSALLRPRATRQALVSGTGIADMLEWTTQVPFRVRVWHYAAAFWHAVGQSAAVVCVYIARPRPTSRQAIGLLSAGEKGINEKKGFCEHWINSARFHSGVAFRLSAELDRTRS